jgi:phytoene synthase
LRPAFDALFGIDAAMADVVRTTTQPMLGQVRLAWWRERLEELEANGAPAEPRLKAAAEELIPRGIAGPELAKLEDGWLPLLEDFPWTLVTAEAVAFRGRILFGLANRLLEQADERVERFGAVWALVDVARHCSDRDSLALLLEQARKLALPMSQLKIAGHLRPLSVFAALAIRDISGEMGEPEGTPSRAGAMLMHRMTGRLPPVP